MRIIFCQKADNVEVILIENPGTDEQDEQWEFFDQEGYRLLIRLDITDEDLLEELGSYISGTKTADGFHTTLLKHVLLIGFDRHDTNDELSLYEVHGAVDLDIEMYISLIALIRLHELAQEAGQNYHAAQKKESS